MAFQFVVGMQGCQNFEMSSCATASAMWRRAAPLQRLRRGTEHRRWLTLNSKPIAQSLADVDVDFEKRLGVGGFASVYPGRHSSTSMTVAVKTMLPACSAEPYGGEKDLASAIAHEWEVADVLQSDVPHPHVVEYFGHFRGTGLEAKEQGLLLPSWLQTSDPSPDMQLSFFVMEHLPGMSLERYIQMSGALREQEAQLVTRAICEGLSHLHDVGVAHRDVKPENVLFSRGAHNTSPGSWKLIDFSASARIRQQSHTDTFFTEKVGTPGYIAPEILFSQEPYGSKCDLFSLGCTVHAMLTNMYLPRRHPHLGFVLNLPHCLSASGREFVELLIAEQPEKRPTAAEALHHPWLRDTRS